MTVGELLQRCSSRELSEWAAFYSIEPFGRQAEDIGHAITASTIANVNRGKNQKVSKVEDFMPKYEAEEPTTESMIQFAEMMTLGLGGQDLREKREEEDENG